MLPTGAFPAPGWPLQRNFGRFHNRLSGVAMVQIIWQWYCPFVNTFCVDQPFWGRRVALGGIGQKPGFVDGRIEVREYLSVTISFDHNVVDGAPAARFAQHWKELVERGAGIDT